MTTEQGIAIGIVLIIGYVGWLVTAIILYRARIKNRELEKRVNTLEPQ